MNDATQFFNTTAGGGYEIERSLRFNSADSAYLNRTPSVAGNRKTWTWAGWVKKANNGSDYKSFFTAFNTTSAYTALDFSDSDQLRLNGLGGGSMNLTTASVYRDLSAWYHIVVSVDTTQATESNRVKFYVNGAQVTVFGTATYPGLNTDTEISSAVNHQIGRNPYPGYPQPFNGYLADVHFIDGQALDPTSFGEFDTNGVWQPIAYAGSYGTNGFHLPFSDNSTAAALGTDTSGNGNTWTVNNLSVGQVTQATYNSTYGSDITSGEAAKIFDGDLTTYGVATGDFFGFSYSGTHATLKVENTSGSSKQFYIQPWVSGAAQNAGTWAISPGAIANAWLVPANTTAENTFTFPAGYDGVGRIYTDDNEASLRFYDFRTAQQEAVGNDSLVDSPTNYGTDTGAGGEVRGNYATLNPLQVGSSITLSNGNLDIAKSGTSDKCTASTVGMTTGKWYFEVTITNLGGGEYAIGFGKNIPIESYLGSNATTWAYADTGLLMHNASSTSYGSSYTTGDVLGAAFDGDNGTLVFYKNGVSQGTAATGLTQGPYFFAVGVYSSAATRSANFGQRPFAYTAPSGFKALCTTNLPEPTIADGSTAMDILTWTGTGGGSRSFTGLNFSPDLAWVKTRSVGYTHVLWDSVRGAGVSKELQSDSTNAEGGAVTNFSGYLSAFNSDGFSSTAGSSDNDYFNRNATTYVAWTWDAGSSTVTNTEGSISSQVRANASAGFSVVTYTGNGINTSQTIGHGLNIKPGLVILKGRDQAFNWQVLHQSITNAVGRLNTTDAFDTGYTSFGSGSWNPSGLTSTTFSTYPGNSNSAYPNNSGSKYVAYCFAPVDGYSSAFSYSGNGSSDGPYTYLGFRSRFIIIKRTDTTGDWLIYDTARDSYNTMTKRLYPNLSNAEADASDQALDVTANGFKVRANNANFNASGGTYIGFAFAESPFQYARAR
jgi:hypothetical protein